MRCRTRARVGHRAARRIQGAWRLYAAQKQEWHRLGLALVEEHDCRMSYLSLTDEFFGGLRESRRFDRGCAMYDAISIRRGRSTMRVLQEINQWPA